MDTRVTEDGGAEETFVQPLVVPKTPQRFYFKFGKPVTTAGLYDEGFMKDDEAVQAMYDDVRGDVEDGIDWLLRRRGEDPFRDTGFRQEKGGVWEGLHTRLFTPQVKYSYTTCFDTSGGGAGGASILLLFHSKGGVLFFVLFFVA